MMKHIFILCLSSLFILSSCNLEKSKTRRNTFFIGIDVSGSFTKTASFQDSLKFLSYYIYAHLKGLNGLSIPKDLYVGGIGGDQKEEPQAFFPIHDFEGLKPKDIEKKLVKEFANQADSLTDFNTYFERVALLVKQKNLVLAPIQIVLISDGVPEILRGKGKSKKVKYQAYSKIKVKPLEYLARNVSIRLLYTSPKVGNEWVNYIPRERVKIWTVESKVMKGWQAQLIKGDKYLWKWMLDNIDQKIYGKGFKEYEEAN